MSYPSLHWHDVICIQVLPPEKNENPEYHSRALLIRGKTWDGNPETFRIELFGKEEIQVLQGGTRQELEQAADELMNPRKEKSNASKN